MYRKTGCDNVLHIVTERLKHLTKITWLIDHNVNRLSAKILYFFDVIKFASWDAPRDKINSCPNYNPDGGPQIYFRPYKAFPSCHFLSRANMADLIFPPFHLHWRAPDRQCVHIPLLWRTGARSINFALNCEGVAHKTLELPCIAMILISEAVYRWPSCRLHGFCKAKKLK